MNPITLLLVLLLSFLAFASLVNISHAESGEVWYAENVVR